MIHSKSKKVLDLALLGEQVLSEAKSKKGKKSSLEKFKDKHGIVSKKAQSSHDSHSIGYSEKEKKWYGWSHRAIGGFEVGDVVKPGHIPTHMVGFKARTIDDCEKLARAFAKEVS